MKTEQKKVYRAGLIPYCVSDGQIEMLFMQPSNPEFGGSDFQIAKGRVEDGEDTQVTAIREACEELGLLKGNIIRTEEVGVFMGRTTVYVSKIKIKDMFGAPSFESANVRWMTLTQFMDEGRELHKPVVAACYDKIVEMETHKC